MFKILFMLQVWYLWYAHFRNVPVKYYFQYDADEDAVLTARSRGVIAHFPFCVNATCGAVCARVNSPSFSQVLDWSFQLSGAACIKRKLRSEQMDRLFETFTNGSYHENITNGESCITRIANIIACYFYANVSNKSRAANQKSHIN